MTAKKWKKWDWWNGGGEVNGASGMRGKTSLELCSLAPWLPVSECRWAVQLGLTVTEIICQPNIFVLFFYCGDKILIDNPWWLQTWNCLCLSPSRPSYYRRLLPCLAWAKSFWAGVLSHPPSYLPFLPDQRLTWRIASSWPLHTLISSSNGRAPSEQLQCVSYHLHGRSHKVDTVLMLFSVCMICMWLQACYSMSVEVRG